MIHGVACASERSDELLRQQRFIFRDEHAHVASSSPSSM
jgi:hypothetical protein